EGARLLTAVERAMPPRDPHTETTATPDQRRADGLLALAGATLAADADPDRATVVAVVELAAICDDDPGATAELETGQPLATETARRLLCDSRIEVVVQDRAGIAVGVGTTNRTVSPGLRRALTHRDGHCRFGNCTSTRFLQAHHITPWPSPTTTANLALLCWHHHHLVHEGGWTLSGDPNSALHATNPTGTTTVTSHPHHHPPPGPAPPEPEPSSDPEPPALPGSGPP
ncbi:MAG: HNH endonuclease, partial [Acidimicrobiales bacterium]|nr:HNH endonuclease [Acidimicrobiales bacterium]